MNRVPSSRPPLLPEQPASTPTPQRRRGAFIMLTLLTILLALGLATTLSIIIYWPDTVGLAPNLDVTATGQSLDQTAGALVALAGEIDLTAQANVAAAFDNESTLAALENRQSALESAETQSALDREATVTAAAITSAQQSTQAAINFEGTQIAFSRIATQVELDYQGTQAALARDATAAVLAFATSTPAPDAILSQTPPATITAEPLFVDGFATGVDTGLWEISAAADWSLDQTGNLAAARSGAWMLTQADDLEGYRIEASLLPLRGSANAADYFVLLNTPAAADERGALTLRLSYNGQRLTAAGIYRFTRGQVTEDMGLLNRGLSAVQAVQLQTDSSDQLDIRVEMRDGRVVVVVNEELLLDTTLESSPPPGAVGLQLPAGTRVLRVVVAR